MPLVIGVFYHEAAGSPWALLTETSEMLTNWQSIPDLGDRISVRSADHHLILQQPSTEVGGIESAVLPDDFRKTVVTVTERIYNYSLCDVALVCEYKPF